MQIELFFHSLHTVYTVHDGCNQNICVHVSLLLVTPCLYEGSKDPFLIVPIDGPKVTAALWGPLDQYIITGHENGDLCQWDTKVRVTYM